MKRHKIVICSEKIICVPNGTKLPLKWAILKRRELFFFYSTRGRAAEWTGNARAHELHCITVFCLRQQKKSPKQPNLLGVSHSPQASQNPDVHKPNLMKERPCWEKSETTDRKKTVMDLKEAETYKAHPALSASHRGKD